MTKTFHRGKAEPKPPPPKNITISTKELQEIKDACFTQGKKAGFDEGVHYIVAHVEDILCNELGFNSREELVKSGKMPAIWIAALVKAMGRVMRSE